MLLPLLLAKEPAGVFDGFSFPNDCDDDGYHLLNIHYMWAQRWCTAGLPLTFYLRFSAQSGPH